MREMYKRSRDAAKIFCPPPSSPISSIRITSSYWFVWFYFVCLLIIGFFFLLLCFALHFYLIPHLVLVGQSFIGTNCPSVTVRTKVTSQSYDNSSGMHPKGSQAQISRALVNSAL